MVPRTREVAISAHETQSTKESRSAPSILLADNHFVTRHGMKQIIQDEFRGIEFGEVGTAGELFSELEKRIWSIVILEISIPGNRGLHILETILNRQPGACVLIHTIHPEHQYGSRALDLGAVAYVTKDSSRAVLLKGLRRALECTRQQPPARAIQREPGRKVPKRRTPEALSPQEFKVLLALASGKRPVEIANDLGLNVKTVSTYKKRIFSKLQLKNDADLFRYAMDHHLF